MDQHEFNQKERELLVKIDVKLERAINDINELKNNFAARVNSLETNMITKDEVRTLVTSSDKTHDDFERRVRRLEQWGFIAIGALTIIQFILNYAK
jgi:HAMP domain-containing protein